MAVISRMYRLRRKRKPDAVKLNLMTSHSHHGKGKVKISRVSVPLIQLPRRTRGTDIHATGYQYAKDAGELELDLPDEMGLCLHHEQGTATSVQRSRKKRTHERAGVNGGNGKRKMEMVVTAKCYFRQ